MIKQPHSKHTSKTVAKKQGHRVPKFGAAITGKLTQAQAHICITRVVTRDKMNLSERNWLCLDR